MIKIFTEAGKGIGFGHLTRCSALRDELERLGRLVELIVHLKDVKIDNKQFTDLDWLSVPIVELIESAEAVIIDSYIVTHEWLEELRQLDCLSVHLDDYNRLVYPVDLIINPNVFADNLDYSNQKARCVGGTEYVILREPFRNIRHESKASETNKPTLLITLGGSDYRQILAKLATWAVKLDLFHVQLVAPEGFGSFIPKVKVLPILEAEDMVKEMNQADVVISGCGQTLHELATLKKPTLGICLDIDQIPNHEYYNGLGFIPGNLWWDQEDLQERVESELRRLSSFNERKNVINGLKEFNPNGVVNVAREILESLK